MKALIWKEIRENLHWTLLLALLLGAAMAYQLYNSRYSYGDWSNISSAGFLTVTSFGFSLAGLALGFLQVLPETKKDRWAFFVHRPVSMHRLFFCKIAAGLTLYFFAILLPFAGAILCVTLPLGPEFPFTPAMVQPGLIDALTGLFFYGASFMAALMPGKWYGTRVLPLLAAFAIVFLSSHTVAAHAGMTLPYLLGGLAFLLFSAWALFLHTGPLRYLSPLEKIALIPVFSSAWAVLLFFLLVLAGTLLFPSKPLREVSHYEVEPSGRIVQVLRKTNRSFTVLDLKGNELKTMTEAEYYETKNNLFALQATLSVSPGPDNRSVSFRRPESYFTFLYNRSRGSLAWFYDHEKNVFLGYDKEKMRLAGYFGRNASLTPHWDPKNSFPGPVLIANPGPFSERILAFPQSVYWADPSKNRVSLLLETSPDTPVKAAAEIETEASDRAPDQVAIATGKALHILSTDGKPRLQYPFPPELGSRFRISVAPLNRGSRYVAFFTPLKGKSIQVVEFNGDGKILSEIELPRFSGDDGVFEADKTLFLSSPLWPPALLPSLAPEWKRGALDSSRALANPSFILFCTCSTFFSFLAAVLSWSLRHRMDLNLKLSIMWALILFVFGIHGFLAFLVIQGFPRRSACPSCGKKRFLHQTHCRHCHSPWPKRKADGTEIREPVLAEK